MWLRLGQMKIRSHEWRDCIREAGWIDGAEQAKTFSANDSKLVVKLGFAYMKERMYGVCNRCVDLHLS